MFEPVGAMQSIENHVLAKSSLSDAVRGAVAQGMRHGKKFVLALVVQVVKL